MENELEANQKQYETRDENLMGVLAKFEIKNLYPNCKLHINDIIYSS